MTGATARLVNGVIVPGDWAKPGIGASRYYERARAERKANLISTLYGPGVWEAKVEAEPSRKDPAVTVYQVYIRSLGAIEGLRPEQSEDE